MLGRNFAAAKKRSRIAVSVICAATLALAACGGSGGSESADSGGASDGATAQGSGSVYEQLNGLSGSKQVSQALSQAKKEGELSLYSGTSSTVTKELAQGFEKKYGIHVKVFRSHSEDVLQRLAQESKAGRIGADVAIASYSSIVDIADLGIVGKFDGSVLSKYPKSVSRDGWTVINHYLYVPVWNTDIIKASDEPHSWTDLADPRYDGKITFEKSDAAWFGALSTYWKKQGKTDDEISDLWSKIFQGATVASGHSSIMQLLGAGQTGIAGMEYDFIAKAAKAKGAPVAYVNSDGKIDTPAFAYPTGASMIKDAEHPAAAWLFMNWLMQPDGGQKIQKGPGMLEGADISSVPKATKVVEVPKEVVQDISTWSERFDQVTRGHGG